MADWRMRPRFGDHTAHRLIALVLAFGAFSNGASAQTDMRRDAVEHGLQPVVIFNGVVPAWSIEDRMAKWRVPGVSVAVIEDGRIAWVQGYGVLKAGETAPVTPRTRFQAASIGKPVAAAAALSLVQSGSLALDADINAALVSWRLPPSPWTRPRPVTLRDLLSHTAGLTVHGFAGYGAGAVLPTLVQILDGVAPANSPPVISEAVPGTVWKYSGGGYEIVQKLIEDTTGEAFAEVMRERILIPAAMTDSGYAVPSKSDAASGHGSDGPPISGDWRTYPEQAAAGLWTTPGDLARFGLALAAALDGEPGAVLSPRMAKLMIEPVMGGYGLGPGISGEGADLALSHGGSNEGFRAFWLIHPRTRDGVVVMTNGAGGDRLMMEIVRAVAKVYGWPDQASLRRARFPLEEDALRSREGRWVTEIDGDQIVFIVRRAGEDLIIATPRGSYAFTAVSGSMMQSGEIGESAEFKTSASGEMVLEVYGLTLTLASF